MLPVRAFAIVIPFLLLTAGGCVRYEFDVVQPAELQRHIGADKWEVAHWGPIDYGLRTVDDHLIVEVNNKSNDEMRILGDRSYVVGPSGQTHPLAGQAIAPGSFVRMVLPPVPRIAYAPGPTVGFGVGVGYGHFGHHGYWGGGYNALYWDEPRYYAVYEGPAGAYWEWNGEGEARLHLVIQQGSDPKNLLTHSFTFARRKVK